MKSILSIIIGLAVLAGSQAPAATIYTDQDTVGFSFSAQAGRGTYSGTWDLLSEGYTPGTPTISALAEFVFSDPNGGTETVVVSVGGQQLYAGFGTPGTSDFVISGAVTGGALVNLESTGLLSYRIFRNTGIFTLDTATLTVAVNDQDPNGVPDGGTTVALLGLGLAGLAGIRRKLSI